MLKSLLNIALLGSFGLLDASIEFEKILVTHVQESIDKAERGESKLTKEILAIEGLSGIKVRDLLNNLCSLPGGIYLEIGVWKGSTFVSALYGNEANLLNAVAIDNWSEFVGSRNAFLNNTEQFLSKNTFLFHEGDSFEVDLKSFQEPINIYFYDGDHSFASQRLALVYYNQILADNFILIVDDYNWENVQKGTQKAISDLGFKIVFEKFLPARYPDRENWWNGLYVAVLSKK